LGYQFRPHQKSRLAVKDPGNIYDYLVTNFTYNYGNISPSNLRKGSLESIASPSLVLCTEFTDTFVSLARSLEIPSREINGYGYTKNSTLQPQNTQADVLHSWPEYYDSGQKRWIAIDPTWGNTTGGIDYFNKLDFSHIAFVRHGSEDSYPLPAGAYKSNPSDKYIDVEIAEELEPTLNYEIKAEGGKNIIYNTGNVALVSQNVTVGNETITIPYLPPYGQYEVTPQSGDTLLRKIKTFFLRLATWAHIR
jgi:hypothetical protein